jgi:hypothetical protein
MEKLQAPLVCATSYRFTTALNFTICSFFYKLPCQNLYKIFNLKKDKKLDLNDYHCLRLLMLQSPLSLFLALLMHHLHCLPLLILLKLLLWLPTTLQHLFLALF